MNFRIGLLSFLLVLSVCRIFAETHEKEERVYLDASGVIRWTADHREVALSGANYSLASACDYRAAGYVSAKRKELAEADLAHFNRMGWDGMRLCFWGDWENADEKGNLLVNDHLDVLDYTIAVAKKRGINILFTPITTYSSIWPDGQDSDAIRGFSKVFPKGRLGLDPAAIAAQCNYLKQILEHVNPYTGVALKDEPSIVFIELINEPDHHPEDFAGSVRYIDALANAVRNTGCRKLLFYNLSQDFEIAPAIKASSVPGLTFAWYPTGLNSGHELKANALRTVDNFPPMSDPALLGHPRLVYEFDSADMNSGYMYPAMARTFREAGAQFMSMFSYDMLATAPYNLGWQTHFLNLIYAPKKALSAIIAGEVARTIPRFSHWGDYPDNTRFGPFRVSYEEDLSEMVTEEKFLYANTTKTSPPKPAALREIIGLGNSPLVNYPGRGTYFLEKIEAGIWRLELYPDAVEMLDPFAQSQNKTKPAIRLIARPWPMTIKLPDLGDAFEVRGINQGNTQKLQAHAGTVVVKPGVYLLTKKGQKEPNKLPNQVNGVQFAEFVCPSTEKFSAKILPNVPDEYVSSAAPIFAAEVISEEAPAAVKFYLRKSGETKFSQYTMSPTSGYSYAAVVPVSALQLGDYEYYFEAETKEGSIRSPEDSAISSHTKIVSPVTPLVLFGGTESVQSLSYTRIGDGIRRGIAESLNASGTEPAALRVFLPLSKDSTLPDYTASKNVVTQIISRGESVRQAKTLTIRARASADELPVYLTLVEADGTAWTTALTLHPQWTEQRVVLDQLAIARSAMLPLGFPGRWNYWCAPAKGRGGSGDNIQREKIERLQLSLRPAAKRNAAGPDSWADLASVVFEFDSNSKNMPAKTTSE